jgi:hypothetical protein
MFNAHARYTISGFSAYRYKKERCATPFINHKITIPRYLLTHVLSKRELCVNEKDPWGIGVGLGLEKKKT